MSIAEFSAALKDQAYKSWYKKSQKSILVQSAKELRAGEQVASKTSFILRPADIVVLANKLAGREVSEKELEQIVRDLKSAVPKQKGRQIPIVKKDDATLYYPRVSFDKINDILDKGFKSLSKQLIEDKGVTREVRATDFFHRGHVFGVATNLLDQTISNFKQSQVPENIKNRFINIMEEILAELKKEDIATSNVKDLSYPLYAKYSKNKYRYLVEMQWGLENQASGQSAAPILNMLRRYLDPENYTQLNKFFRTRASSDEFIQKLITSKGSPSYLDLIEQEIVSILAGKPTNNTEYKSGEVLLDTFKIPIDTKEINKKIKKDIEDTKKSIAALKAVKTSPIRDNKGQFTSLTSLQVLINRKLAEQIQRNMGSGFSKSVLNYRTGRFASSAQVERLTISQQGMITAFYSYMKNPYQTFEPGFKQGSPKSRDPKLLISKSIREIAGESMTNRLRAVAV